MTAATISGNIQVRSTKMSAHTGAFHFHLILNVPWHMASILPAATKTASILNAGFSELLRNEEM
jgi:hypothetical protein